MDVSYEELVENFPYREMRENQKLAFEKIAENGRVVLELPTGTGKTAIGYTWLKTLYKKGVKGSFFYLCPTKTLVDQVVALHPDVVPVYGKGEYKCLVFKGVSADEAPCALIKCELKDSTCPYYIAKRRAIQSGRIVACTVPFYIYQALFTQKRAREELRFPEPFYVVVDEAHALARVIRSTLSFYISSAAIKRAIKITEEFDEGAHKQLKAFYDCSLKLAKIKPYMELLNDYELGNMISILRKINTERLRNVISQAIEEKVLDLDKKSDFRIVQSLEKFISNVGRYIRNLEYALGENPLNYIYIYYDKEGGAEKGYKIVINPFYVGGLVRKHIVPRAILYSATIGKIESFEAEIGAKGIPFYSFPSEFPPHHARIYLPTDTPNLAVNKRNRGDVTRAMTLIGDAIERFLLEGYRSLVVVVSEHERQKFISLNSHRFSIVSYGNGEKPRESAQKFKRGEGDVLVGTSANYAEGLDLPGKIAPVIFFLRPSYPPPYTPLAKFEDRRFGTKKWMFWKWRVFIEAMQVRGRNIRSAEDIGATFFISQQFESIIKNSLPKWLESSLVSKPYSECVDDALRFLGGEPSG